MKDDAERMLVLETKMTYQEASIEDLGALVLEQGRRIDRLEEQLRLTLGKLRELEEEGLPPLAKNERPPHY